MPTDSKSSEAIRVAIDNYRGSVSAYHQFLGVIHPVLDDLPAKDEQHVTQRVKEIVSEFAVAASPGEAKELAEVAAFFSQSVSESITRRATESGVDAPATSTHEGKDERRASREVSPRVGSVLIRLIKALRSRVPAAQHRDILYRGVLTGIVGQFEVLVSDLAHHYYRRAPGSLGGQDKVLSVSELLSFSSIEEATDYVIADRVDDLLRGSAEDWRKFFESRLKVDLAAVSVEWARFVEYIQRRHLIVHAGSRLSRRYLKIVEPDLLKEYFADPQVGQPVRLAPPYVDAALSAFEATGVLLGFACWVRLHRDHATEQSSLLDDYVYETMLAGRWSVVLQFAQWGAEQETFDAISRLTFRFNAWLALKRLGRFRECAGAVEAFDCSAVKTVFSIAQAALLDRLDRLFELVENSKGVDLDERAWREWPLLNEARLDPRFEVLRKRFAPQESTEPAAIHAQLLIDRGSPTESGDAPSPVDDTTPSIESGETAQGESSAPAG